MEDKKYIKPIYNLINQLIYNLSSTQQFISLKNALILNEKDEKQQKIIVEKIQHQIIQQHKQNKQQSKAIKLQHKLQSEKNIHNLDLSFNPHIQNIQKSIPAQFQEEDRLLTFRTNRQLQPKIQREPLSEPPVISGKRNYTEQSSQKSKSYQKQSALGSRHNNRKSSEQSSVHLDLTQKTKRSKNLSITQGRVDSLLYSDVTLMYSNDTGFDRQASGSHMPGRTQSHKLVLNRIQDDDEGEIQTKMQRAQSRQVDRLRTESQKISQPDKLENKPLITEQSEGHGVFQTQINDYKSKISKIKELKQNKKRKLENELKRVNDQLEQLSKKQRQTESMSNPKPNNFESRVRISDNIQAKVKAQKFVRDLHQQKRSRQDAHLGELQAIDKNINNYMQQLMKERYKNQQRIKQRKKLEIIDRMKQQQMRKIQQQKNKQKNIQFLQQLKTSNSKNNLQQIKKSNDKTNQAQSVKSKERSPSKKSQPIQDKEITPQLSRKKAYLRKLRNLSFKKDKVDAYQQLLN